MTIEQDYDLITFKRSDGFPGNGFEVRKCEASERTEPFVRVYVENVMKAKMHTTFTARGPEIFQDVNNVHSALPSGRYTNIELDGPILDHRDIEVTAKKLANLIFELS